VETQSTTCGLGALNRHAEVVLDHRTRAGYEARAGRHTVEHPLSDAALTHALGWGARQVSLRLAKVTEKLDQTETTISAGQKIELAIHTHPKRVRPVIHLHQACSTMDQMATH